ncbi:hypothetical protein Hanom_Chr02g00175761 [Helianthus anomalus]
MFLLVSFNEANMYMLGLLICLNLFIRKEGNEGCSFRNEDQEKTTVLIYILYFVLLFSEAMFLMGWSSVVFFIRDIESYETIAICI